MHKIKKTLLTSIVFAFSAFNTINAKQAALSSSLKEPMDNLDPVLLGEKVNVYPNPVSGDFFHISLINDVSLQIQLYNYLGEMVYSKSYIPNGKKIVEKISTENFEKSVYFLKVKSGETIITRRIAIK